MIATSETVLTFSDDAGRKSRAKAAPSGIPPGWYGEPGEIGEHMPHDGGHTRIRPIPDD